MSLNRDYNALPFRHRAAFTVVSLALFGGVGLLIGNNEHLAAIGCGGLLVILLLKRVIFVVFMRIAVTMLKQEKPPSRGAASPALYAPPAPAPGPAQRETPPAPAAGGRTRRRRRLPFGRRRPRR